MTKKITVYLLLFALYAGALAPLAGTAQAQRPVRPMNVTPPADPQDGLNFRLSNGTPEAEKRIIQALANAENISESEAAALLRRLPAIQSDPADKSDFNKRAGSMPAPKTGKRIPVNFPVNEGRPTPNGGSASNVLEVIRYSPEGEIGLAPDLSVTFSKPMVAVTSQTEASAVAPVQLSPQVEGKWRWLGTRTLMFDTEKRFPMATKFTARVPAGTRSATGETLAKDVVWTFTTPPPSLEANNLESSVTRRDPLIFVRFDQAIDPAAMLRTTTITAGGRKIAVRLATEAEIAADATVTEMVRDSQPGRWIAFRPVNADGSTANALPGDSTITVTFEKGTPSAEGPLTTAKAQAFSFKTYGAFKLMSSRCGWNTKLPCRPFSSWSLTFSNPINPGTFTPEMVKVEPAVEGLRIYPSGPSIQIDGIKKANTTYTVTVDGALEDQFGQKLGAPVSATFKVVDAVPAFFAQGDGLVILDPFSKPAFSVYSINHSAAKLRIYRVEPEDWPQFMQYKRRLNYDDGKRPPIPGTKLIDRAINIASKRDELTETRIDLGEALPGGLGNVILDIEPAVKSGPEDRSRVFVWIQSTKIGLDAFVDKEKLVGFATELTTGKPIAGVQMRIEPGGAGGRPGIAESDVPTSDDEAEEQGLLSWAWDKVFGSGGPSADSTQIIGAEGETTEISSVANVQTGSTGTDGIARIALPPAPQPEKQSILIARKGSDVAFLPESSSSYWSESASWVRKDTKDTLRWFVFNDRGIYRPQEEVSVKGYVRRFGGGKLADIEPLDGAVRTINWAVKDPRDNEIAKGTTSLNPFGAFDLKFKLPDNANLGYARIEFSTDTSLDDGDTYSHAFQVQEFRRPEFEVTAKVQTEGPHFIRDSVMISGEAKYYSGGGLANAETTWTVSATPTNYTPPNREDYTFGIWMPWWRSYDLGRFGRPRRGGGETKEFEGVTDADGRHILKIDLDSAEPPRPYSMNASVAVEDVNRQTWSGSASLLVHPAELYVGIKTPRTFVNKGENIFVDSVVTDLDGKLVPGKEIKISATLKDNRFERGEWKEVVVDEQSCVVPSTASADAPAKCTFVAKQGGRYTITATVHDDKGRPNMSEFMVWVPGGKMPPKREVDQEEVEIIPSKKEYAPGETAELLIMAPFAPAEGVLTLRSEGLVKVERFRMDGTSATLKIPIEERYLPNIQAHVDIVGTAPRQDDKGEVDPKLPPRPAFAGGNIDLTVSTASRKLVVTAESREKTLAPGSATTIDVQVKDDKGQPVGASEVAVVVVDESVLALTNYFVDDPIGRFYFRRSDGVSDHHSRNDVLLANPVDLSVLVGDVVDSTSSFIIDGAEVTQYRLEGLTAKARSAVPIAPGIAGAAAQDGDAPITLRTNFDALAHWSPTVRTDSSGRAAVPIKLPDNLTRYRITAVAVDPLKRFGKSEADITARQPLMVRPSAPRFMNFGDRIDLPVVVQNQTDKDLMVDVAVRGTNARVGEAAGPIEAATVTSAGKQLLVKANSREEVRFPVSTVSAGTARFQIAVTSGNYSDAAEISLPVWTPATSEAFATYGSVDENGSIVQPVQAPGDVYPQFGGLEVTTSSTQLQELTDAFISLYKYPFENSEQVASRMISIAALKDVLAAFKAEGMPTDAELRASFKRDIEILQSRQRDNGGFGVWRKDGERFDYPFLAAHVAHALWLAKKNGYPVPAGMLEKTSPYLKNIEKHFDEWHLKAPFVRQTVSAYALYVRDLMGDKDIPKSRALLAEILAAERSPSKPATRSDLPFEAVGWLLSVLAADPGSAADVDAVVRILLNRTAETASTANFVTSYSDGQWLVMHSNRRADGVLLESLIKVREARKGAESSAAADDLVPKLVRGLLAHRSKGHWGSTQENVFILLALEKYFQAYEKATPQFVARLWLGNSYGGEQAFRGRSIDSNVLTVPMADLIGQGSGSDLILDKQGEGRLYYRIGLKYAPKDVRLAPADYGFTVLRSYEAIDDPEDVKRSSDGAWSIRSGARVRVRLTMVAQARRYHVALVDPLPAGFEILNPELAVTEAIPADKGGRGTTVDVFGSTSFGGSWWRRNWFDHQNFRDERAEAFASLLWEGVYNYSYVARATTPGRFVVPPAKAEEMYAPETFGRTGTDIVNVN